MIFDFLNQNGIEYQRVDHPAVYTCEEAERLVPPLPGVALKNLFLRDGKGKEHFLLAVPPELRIDLKALGASLGIPGLGFASPERLKKYLGLEPGAVTLLGVINDRERAVKILIDRNLWNAEAFQCHPLVNTSTLSLSKAALEKVFIVTGHHVQLVDLPSNS